METVAACRNLGEFLARLEAAGELCTVRVPVEPLLEIAAITDRVCKAPALNMGLLFESVHGSPFPVATNLFGSGRRLALALGLESLDELSGRFAAILAEQHGRGSLARLDSLAGSSRWRGMAPLLAAAPPVELGEQRVDLGVLPVLKGAPEDGAPDHAGRVMTLPLVTTASPDGGEVNWGMYRCAVVGPDRLAISWGPGSGAARHALLWQKGLKPMPVTVALGGPPALTFAATLPLPDRLDEASFAGLLSGGPLPFYRCANGLPAPAEAEAVMEGYLHPEELCGSGAFGNHSGYYTPAAAVATLRVTSLRLREKLVYPATIVGRPPMEDCWFVRGWERLLLPLVQLDLAEIVEMHHPFAGIFHGGVIIAVRETHGRGVELLRRLKGLPWFGRYRLLVLVDAEQDPRDEAGVCWRIMNNVAWGEDLHVEGDTLCMDATRKSRERRHPVTPDVETVALVARRWREYGFETE
jgi:4-hydroxy-3-polyprenylbenzoate decarboxylase